MALQATNAGINYQSRVSAWFFACMLFEEDISTINPIYPKEIIRNIQLEGNTAIDDIILTFESGVRYLFQAKRTISFSVTQEGEFRKVLKQFIEQYTQGVNTDKYVLITTAQSSRKITNDLRNILDSLRLSTPEDVYAQFNKNDRTLWKEFTELCNSVFSDVTGKHLDTEAFEDLVSRVYVEIVDVEDGGTFEKLALIYLKSHTEFDSMLLWKSLISFSLSTAANRRNIEKSKLKNEFSPYVYGSISEDGTQIEVISDFDESNIWKDYLVCTSEDMEKIMEVEDGTIFIFDMYRFGEGGKKKINYQLQDIVTLENGMKFTVLFRGASFVGVERFLDEFLDDEAKATGDLVFLPAHDSDEINDFEKMHIEYIKNRFKSNGTKECVICGDAFNDSDGYIIEIDNDVEPNDAGLAHKGCLREIDRVMGIAGVTTNGLLECLRNIDISDWIGLLESGQGAINGLSAMNKSIYQMVWNPDNNMFIDGKFSIRTRLENDDYVYTKERGKVDRLSKQAAKRLVREMNEGYERARKNNNPFCYSDKTYTFGHYEQLVQMVGGSENYLECIESEMVPYSKHLAKLNNTCEMYYAPQMVVFEDDQYFTLGSIVPLLSDITQVEEYFKNWEIDEHTMSSLNIKVIRNDKEFDNIVRMFKSDGLGVVINPRFGKKKELISGVILNSMADISNKSL